MKGISGSDQRKTGGGGFWGSLLGASKDYLGQAFPALVEWLSYERFCRKLVSGGLSVWEKEMRLLHLLVRRGWVCFDVGANVGLYTYHLSRLVGDEGHVYSFEPVPQSFARLRATKERFRLQNVTYFSLALSDKAGEAPMIIPRIGRRPWYTRAFLSEAVIGTPAGAQVRVRSETIDRIVALEGLSRLDFLKVDVEGAEFRVIQGAASTINAFRPIMLLEVEDRHAQKFGWRGEQLFHLLEARLGYAAYTYTGTRLDAALSIIPEENNYLFVPREKCPVLLRSIQRRTGSFEANQ